MFLCKVKCQNIKNVSSKAQDQWQFFRILMIDKYVWTAIVKCYIFHKFKWLKVFTFTHQNDYSENSQTFDCEHSHRNKAFVRYSTIPMKLSSFSSNLKYIHPLLPVKFFAFTQIHTLLTQFKPIHYLVYNQWTKTFVSKNSRKHFKYFIEMERKFIARKRVVIYILIWCH